MRKRKVAGLVCLTFLLATTLRASVLIARFAKVQREFSSLQIGQSRQSVVSKLGKPSYYSGRCGVIATPLPNCSLEYIYAPPLAPFYPDYYVVSFSSDDQIIDADRYPSP